MSVLLGTAFGHFNGSNWSIIPDIAAHGQGPLSEWIFFGTKDELVRSVVKRLALVLVG